MKNARSEGRRGGHKRPPLRDGYFFTHLLAVSSQRIVEIFSHADLFFGAPLAMAMPGATAPKAMAVRRAVVSSFFDI
jgi:hypothetical protein